MRHLPPVDSIVYWNDFSGTSCGKVVVKFDGSETFDRKKQVCVQRRDGLVVKGLDELFLYQREAELRRAKDLQEEGSRKIAEAARLFELALNRPEEEPPEEETNG